MSPYIMEVCCDVCGGKGMAALDGAANQWLGHQLRHKDPAICAAILRRKKEELEKKEKELKN